MAGPEREDYWASRLYRRTTGGDQEYTVGVPDPVTGQGGYGLDYGEHYDPYLAFSRVQAYSDLRGLGLDCAAQLVAAQYNYRDLAVRAVSDVYLSGPQVGEPNGEGQGVPQYHAFLAGIARHYLATGSTDADDEEAADILMSMLAHSSQSAYRENYGHVGAQRESALNTWAMCERYAMGLGEHPRIDDAVDMLLSLISQWTEPDETKRYGVWLKLFMGGLVSTALIRYRELFGESVDSGKVSRCAAIPAALQEFSEYIWDRGYIQAGVEITVNGEPWTHGSIRYMDEGRGYATPVMAPLTDLEIVEVGADPRREFHGPPSLSEIDGYYIGAMFTVDGIADYYNIIGYEGATRKVILGGYYPFRDLTTSDTFGIQPNPQNRDLTEGDGPSPDLGHMVCGLYMWLYRYYTIEAPDAELAATQRARGIEMFDSCYHCWPYPGGDAFGQKQWNQSTFALDGLGWLAEGDASEGGGGGEEGETRIILLSMPGGKVLMLTVAAGEPEEPSAAPEPPATIQVHHSHEEFPNPCLTFDVYAWRDGDWSDPDTWSTGEVPSSTDRVVIHANTVTVDDEDAVAGPVLVMDAGKLYHSRTANSTLTCDDLIGITTAEWHVHGATEDDPIPADLVASVVVRDTPLESTALDPKQHRRGVIWTGETKVRSRGAPKTCHAPDLRLAVEPEAGHTTLTFATAPSGWRVGDTVVIPPTDPYYSDIVNEDRDLDYLFEERTIESIDGAVVTLDPSLDRDHLGAHDPKGELPTIMPHALNLTRNVRIESENPDGVRGHEMYAERCDLIRHHVESRSMGRTFGSTPFGDGTTDAQHENQKGRYALHLHHLMGPVNEDDEGYQSEVVGCTFYDSRKWPIALHGTSYNLIQDNNIYWFQHSGISLEDGNESRNTIHGNFTAGVHAGLGLSSTEITEAKSPAEDNPDWPVSNHIWLLQPTFNTLTSNVGAGGRGSGYFPHFIHLDGLRRGGNPGNTTTNDGHVQQPFPLHRGADIMHGTEGVDWHWVDVNNTDFDTYASNECYTLTKGPSFDHWTGHLATPIVIADTVVWKCFIESIFIYGGLQPITIDGLVGWHQGQFGVSLNEQNAMVRLINPDIRCVSTIPGFSEPIGVVHIGGCGGIQRFEIEGGNIVAPTAALFTFPSVASSESFPVNPATSNRVDTLRGVTLRNPDGQVTPVLVRLEAHYADEDTVVPCIPVQVFLYDHQASVGDNRQLFYVEQLGTTILPAAGEVSHPGYAIYAGVTPGQTDWAALAAIGRCYGNELIPPGAIGPSPAGFPGAYYYPTTDPED